MSELGRCAQPAFYLVETFDMRGREVHWFCAFARGGEIVKSGCKRSLLIDIVAVEVYEAEERL